MDLYLQGVRAQGDDALDVGLCTVDEPSEDDLTRWLIRVDVLKVRLAASSDRALHETGALPYRNQSTSGSNTTF